MSSNSTGGPILVGGIPIVWLVVLSCALIVIGVCALSYPLILLNRWRMREKGRTDVEEEQDDEDEEEEPRRKKKGGALFGRGRPSMRGKWVERIDPQTNSPYYEHTGTGEVTWNDPRPSKMRANKAPPPGPSSSLVAASMMQHPSMSPGYPAQGYGAPGGFGAPAPRLPSHGSMGMMPTGNPMMAQMGVMPPQMQGPPRMAPGQPFQGAPMQMQMQPPTPGGGPGVAPPGMVSAGSMRRTQAPQGPGPQMAAAAPAPAPAAPAPAPPAADPKFDKYTRMQKAGLPEGAIRNAMVRDGMSESEQKTFFGN